jgi:phage gp29-like protein
VPVPSLPPPEIQVARLSRIVNPWPAAARATWGPSKLATALRMHSQGQFSLASQLWDAMREDDEIPGAVATRVNATLGSDFSLRSEDPARVALPARARRLELEWCEIAPDAALQDLLADYLMLGVGLATIDWDFGDGSHWTPRLRPLPAEHLEYDLHEQVWRYHARDGRVDVTPGDGKWLLLANGERPWLNGYVRSLAALWRAKQLVLGDWARYCQKHGLPLLKAKMPIFRDAAEKDQFVDDLEALQSEGVIGLPQDDAGNGYDVELLEATTVSWQTFQAALERSDRKIQVQLLGGNAATETVGSTGSRNVAEVQSRGLVAKARRDARALTACLRAQLVRPYAIVNWGARGEIPVPCYDVAPEADVQAWENSRLQFANTLKTFAEAGYSIANLPAVARDLGLELTEREPLGAAPPADETDDSNRDV